MCFANFFSLPNFGQLHIWTDMDETNQTCCIDIICLLHRWKARWAPLSTSDSIKPEPLGEGLMVMSSRHTNDAVRIFTYEYLSEKTHEMGWSHTSRSESQQHECENIINQMHLFIVSRVVPTKIGNKFISEYASKFQNMESCISWRPIRYLAWDVVIYNIKLSTMQHHQNIFPTESRVQVDCWICQW